MTPEQRVSCLPMLYFLVLIRVAHSLSLPCSLVSQQLRLSYWNPQGKVQTRQARGRSQPRAVRATVGKGWPQKKILADRGSRRHLIRLYRESHQGAGEHFWYNLAGSIDELREVATKLDSDGSQAAKRLSARIMASMTRFEATEEVRT